MTELPDGFPLSLHGRRPKIGSGNLPKPISDLEWGVSLLSFTPPGPSRPG